MVVISQDQIEADDLYATMHQIDRSLSDILEGGSGMIYLGELIPFDDADVFAVVLSTRDSYDSFRDCLEQSAGMTYHQLFDLDRESVSALQKTLPGSTVEEIFRRAQGAKASIQTTCRTFAAAIRGRMLGITFDHGDSLAPENLVHSWHALCADYSALRHLVSDLSGAAWPDLKDRWRDLEPLVVDSILAMRDCFDWDRMTSQRSQGQAPISWPLASDVQEQLEEVRTHLSRADTMWKSLRDGLLKELDEHFEFYGECRIDDE